MVLSGCVMHLSGAGISLWTDGCVDWHVRGLDSQGSNLFGTFFGRKVDKKPKIRVMGQMVTKAFQETGCRAGGRDLYLRFWTGFWSVSGFYIFIGAGDGSRED